MDLKQLQAHWNNLAKDDPLWSILSDPTKRHGRWHEREFFDTGVAEIRLLMAYVATHVPSIQHRRALDFGCGVGRLTQALCSYFSECDGVDIAPTMIDQAVRFNKHGDRCQYHLNATDNLHLFPNDSFDLIYSNVVLQHMPPELFEQYISEFVRLLAESGFAIFQLPDEQGSVRGPTRFSSAGPLPETAFQARLECLDAPRMSEGDVDVAFEVRVTNLSDIAWPSSSAPDGRLRINVGNHWLDRHGLTIVANDGRASLRSDLEPGASRTVTLWTRTPAYAGRYVLELDIVQEGVAWFQQKGSTTTRVPIDVKGRSVRVAGRLKAFVAGLTARHGAGQVQEPSTKLIMYGVGPTRVAAVVSAAGGTLVDIRRDGQRGEWPGYVYTVTKGIGRDAFDISAFISQQEDTVMSACATITITVDDLTVHPGQAFTVPVTVRNDSVKIWRAAAPSETHSLIRLGNHWLARDGHIVTMDDARVSLTHNVNPGETTSLNVKMQAPASCGQYLLEFDMVREGVAWFSDLGSPTARVKVDVT